ncbi:hypothetical protein A4R29_17365 [Mesorhizobium ciceri biovar biserrulae]|nr:hypothetical protein A4R29_17365 [Mesorhizobium ciceri biovar biserrulae]
MGELLPDRNPLVQTALARVQTALARVQTAQARVQTALARVQTAVQLPLVRPRIRKGFERHIETARVLQAFQPRGLPCCDMF